MKALAPMSNQTRAASTAVTGNQVSSMALAPTLTHLVKNTVENGYKANTKAQASLKSHLERSTTGCSAKACEKVWADRYLKMEVCMKGSGPMTKCMGLGDC